MAASRARTTGRFRFALFTAAILLATVFAASSVALAQSQPTRKKLIATGWDSPTAAQFRQHLAEFERWPFDGTTVQPTRRLADGREVDGKFAFTRDRWRRREFKATVADLRAAHPRTGTDNFLMIHANPGDVDWFDEAGWKEIVEHWRLLAWVARAGKLRGLLFDAEPYTPPYEQFKYPAQPQADRHTFPEYAAKARERGRAVMRAVTAEFPNLRIFTYRLLCDLLPALAPEGGVTTALEGHAYGLVPAFVNGWFDVMPPTVTVIEGNENAYRYNSTAEFDRAFVELRTRALALVAPEHRARFCRQYQISHGIYLDAHINPPTSPWHVDRLGGTPAARLEANVGAALRAADEYVWIYGETGRWWPSGNPKHPFWPEKFAGAERALFQAKDPIGAARRRLATAKVEENRLLNPAFDTRDASGQPQSWWFWQADTSHGHPAHDADTGALAKGSARVIGASNGCFGQRVQVRAGEQYALSVRARVAGRAYAGVLVRWKNAVGQWTAQDQDVRLAPAGPADCLGWRECLGSARVPDKVAELVLLLTVQGQAVATDTAWFDDARVVRLE